VSEAKKIAQIDGVRWVEKNAGRASGWGAEAYFFLDFLPTFSSMEKVRERKILKCKIKAKKSDFYIANSEMNLIILQKMKL
jgi:hypothetical protein